jgi:hypothetical protein
LRLCTAKSALYCNNESFTSFSKTPFWSIAKKGRLSMSPLVVISSILNWLPLLPFFNNFIIEFVCWIANLLARVETTISLNVFHLC